MANDSKHTLKVFLCHASGDKPAVLALYRRLIGEGIDAWLDQEKLLPGQDWEVEISRAVKDSDVVVICLSNKSITKEGFVQKEIRFALDVASEKPEGTIFLIPARLEPCQVPFRLSRWQWVDLFNEHGFEHLMRSLRLRAEELGLKLKNHYEPALALEPQKSENWHGKPTSAPKKQVPLPIKVALIAAGVTIIAALIGLIGVIINNLEPADISNTPTVAACPYPWPRNLREGMTGEDVAELQRRLNKDLNVNLKVDGIFGPETRQAAAAFQRKEDLTPVTGDVGPITRAALDSICP
jgi:hypothetical protein